MVNNRGMGLLSEVEEIVAGQKGSPDPLCLRKLHENLQ